MVTVLLLGIATKVSGQSVQLLDSLKSALSQETAVEKRIELLKTIGEGFMNQTPNEAIAYFEELILIAEQQQSNLLKAYTLNRIGVCWLNLNDSKQSIEFYFKALEATEEKPAYYDIKARIYNNLGWSFKKLEDYGKALQYFVEAEGYARKEGTKSILALILNNKGVTEKDLRRFEEALVSLNESLQLNREIGNKRQERFNLNNIAVIYSEQNRYFEAIEKLKEVLELNEQLSDTVELINNLQNLGNAYTGIGDYKNSESSFLKSIELAEQKKTAEMKYRVLSDLTAMYRKQGKYKEALHYFETLYRLSDSIKAQETKRYAIELESRYNNLVNERALDKAHKELAEQKLYVTWFITALIFALLIVAFFLRVIIMKRRNERELIVLNHEIEAQSEELRQANEEVHSINENLERHIAKRTAVIQNQNDKLRQFAFMNAHEIRGPVASILGLINLLTDTRNESMSRDLIQHLQTSAKKLDEVIHDVNRQLEEDDQIVDVARQNGKGESPDDF
ncbi:MAG: tetratricopeptide repeat-containing sensor histidine kinase [Cyclobacteriaceae bacterium]|nr:tetratricopeptide repeat-containing sensor histidine kinase [Cyclobacteriaceae bacterium]